MRDCLNSHRRAQHIVGSSIPRQINLGTIRKPAKHEHVMGQSTASNPRGLTVSAVLPGSEFPGRRQCAE